VAGITTAFFGSMTRVLPKDLMAVLGP